MFYIDTLKPNDISDVNEMLDQAFGVERFEKAVYRLRDGIEAVAELSFVVRRGDGVTASLQFWPIEIKNGATSLDGLLLGPIAVRADCQGEGIGQRLMEHGLDKARDLGHSRVVLVGDQSYYQKVGFCRRLARGLAMAGEVDKDRLLARELVPGSLKNAKGVISRIK